MSLTTFLLLALVVVVASFVQGAVGVGFALIVAPIASLVAPAMVPVSLLILMVPLNLYVSWRERPAVDSGGTLWITLGRIAGAVGGVWILSRLSAHNLNLLIGIFTIVAAAATLYAPSFTPGRNVFVLAGAVTGITETATGIGGPALAMVFQHHKPPALRSTIALCFAIGEVVSLVFFCWSGRVRMTTVEPALALIPAVALGVLLSRVVHQHTEGGRLRIAVMVFAIVSGALILIQTLA
ncbi:sulfite exporter TauE/SafE family protein [Trinickia dinghuensis]|uniref:Probable membrane transporter protein n=1 Tax=Trinickia dinghuensis TaxID=2291023 RepID=A0A3D8JUU3_9BURK|nr:sulfite exporter TauE/SafE family protein [Trinickia dinghuensis]RDU96859.1 sulfite exporter TauE/SafE family protein [Trinickia dinghuensis]